MNLKKQLNEKKTIRKVTFSMAKNIENTANHVNHTGDLYNWDSKNLPMNKINGGEFSASEDLKQEFKYIINDKELLFEPDTEMFISNEFSNDN